MKIRIGVGVSTRTSLQDSVGMGRLVDDLERLGFDSVWFSERLAGPTLDPMVAMTFAAARTEKLKFGPSVMVLPGRNPVVLAKSLASLDRLSNGRLLPAFGLGVADSLEHQAFGVQRKERAAWFDEALPLLRRLWEEDGVDHHGDRFHLEGVTLAVKPRQQPLEVWMGGSAPAELRRTGRLSDGWLPSFCTARDVAEGMAVVDGAAAEAGREIERGHFGVLVAYTDGPVPERLRRAIEHRRPGADPAEVIAAGPRDLVGRLGEYVDAGASKFVITPLDDPPDWTAELETLAAELLPMQT